MDGAEKAENQAPNYGKLALMILACSVADSLVPGSKWSWVSSWNIYYINTRPYNWKKKSSIITEKNFNNQNRA
jgi:hypothetical protein